MSTEVRHPATPSQCADPQEPRTQQGQRDRFGSHDIARHALLNTTLRSERPPGPSLAAPGQVPGGDQRRRKALHESCLALPKRRVANSVFNARPMHVVCPRTGTCRSVQGATRSPQTCVPSPGRLANCETAATGDGTESTRLHPRCIASTTSSGAASLVQGRAITRRNKATPEASQPGFTAKPGTASAIPGS